MKLNKNLRLFGVIPIAALALSLLTVGCERTVSQTEETKVKNDGTVQTKEKKVTESPDGTVTKTETKSTSTNTAPKP